MTYSVNARLATAFQAGQELTSAWASSIRSTDGNRGGDTNGASHDASRRGVKLNFDTSVCLSLMVLEGGIIRC